MSYINLKLKDNDKANEIDNEFLGLTCFLCNKIFTEIEESFSLFEERFYDNNEKDVPISLTLSSILSRDIDTTSEIHSQVICTECYDMMINYEVLEKQLSDIKNKIIEKYNDTIEYFERNLNEIDVTVATKDEENLVPKNEKLEEISEQENAETFYVYQFIQDKESNITDVENIDKELKSGYTSDEVHEENSFIDYADNQDQEEVYVIAQNNYDPEIDDNQLKVISESISSVSPKFDCENKSRDSGITDNINTDYSYKELYSCKKCGKTFSSQDLLRAHAKHHNKNLSYACEICGRKFVSKYTIKAHEKVHMDRERKYKCSQCKKSFFTQPNLLAHEKTHSGLKDYKCDICHKLLSTQHNLDLHKIIHTGVKPFVCQICGRSFARRAELQDHERIHTGEKPFECDLCGVAFAQRSNLQSHKRATHFNVKSYKCDECEKSFKRRRLLDYHIKSVHTKERPIKCEMCPADFVYPEHYKKHLKSHYGLKSFECEICKKAFYSKENRDAHRFTHSDRKPYECITCHQGFMRKQTLLKHMERENHQNDSIIINNPLIKKDGSIEFQNSEQEYELVEIDGLDMEKNIENYEEIEENIITDIFSPET